MQFTSRLLLFIVVIFLSCSCTTIKRTTQTTADISALNFIGEYEIPFNLNYNGTIVGGLSGIDYNKKKKLYYLISDDRSEKNPARFYTVAIDLTKKGIDSIYFTGVNYMLQHNGKVYSNSKQDPYLTPDPESIRFDPSKRQLVWSSEGERIVNEKDTVLENPFISVIAVNGKFIDSFFIPPNLKMQCVEKGPRKNGVLEGMSFADNYNTLFVNVEEPLYEDGPRADISENGAFIRILKYEVAGKHNIAQYAYQLSPVAYPPNPATAFKINGVSEILSIGNNKLLVIERSFSSGREPCTIRVFIADLTAATDISNMALKGDKKFIPATKKLLINMDGLGIYIDNIEGVSFGPVLPNGNKTLLFIADNNFSKIEKTQVLLFEVIEN